MKRTAILALTVLTLAFAGAAYADASQLIPSFHWTYRSLGVLAQNGLINENVEPGKSAYTPEQAAAMVVMAVKKAERDITKLGAEELAALDRVLYNRGIRGIVILPTPENTLPPGLRLDRLACATIDLSLRTPNLPRATPDYFAATVLAMEKLTQKGYRRIGFYSNDLEIRRIGDRWLGGVLFAQQMLPEAARVPPLILATSTDPDPDRSWAKMREAFFVWLNREKPDVILANSLHVVLWLEEAGCRIPQDVGFASLSACLTSPVGHWNNENIHSMAGINQQTDLVAAQALDLVANQIFNNEFGLPESAPMVLIPPLWKDGETLAR